MEGTTLKLLGHSLQAGLAEAVVRFGCLEVSVSKCEDFFENESFCYKKAEYIFYKDLGQLCSDKAPDNAWGE